MRKICATLLAMLMVGCVSDPKNTSENAVSSSQSKTRAPNTKEHSILLAQAKAGPTAKNCGVIENSSDAESAFDCAYNARPYWFVINYGPIGWWAVANPAQGDPMLIYTPNYYWQGKRKLVVFTCKRLQFNQIYDQQPIHCLTE